MFDDIMNWNWSEQASDTIAYQTPLQGTFKGGEESLKTIQNLFPLAKEEVTKGNTEKVGIFGSSKMPQNTRLSIHCTHSYRDRLGLHSLSVFFSGG